MSTLAHTVSDSATMLRRDLRHLRRYPVMTISAVIVPTSMLLLFVYVFGGAMGAALGAALGSTAGDGTSYIDYVVPGILLMAVGSGCASTAVSVNADMTEGIIARFRIMAISRASVLTGHVAGSMIRTMAGIVLVLGVALVIGFRPTAGPVAWVASIGVITMFVLAFTWLAVALGMAAKSPEGANGSTLLLQFGPFLSSAFVRPESMPAGMRWFAENMPFTPMIDTLLVRRHRTDRIPLGARGLLPRSRTIAAGCRLTRPLWLVSPSTRGSAGPRVAGRPGSDRPSCLHRSGRT